MSDLEVIGTTTKKTYEWLKDVMDELEWEDRHKAYLALRSTLHAVRDRLTVEEAADFGAQLPMLIRGLYYEGWHPADKPSRETRRKEEFLDPIQKAFRDDPSAAPEQVARGVFRVLSRRVTAGELEDVKRVMPKAVAELWP